MVRKTVSLAEAKKRLSEIVARAAFGGESFLITRRGRPAAILRPARGERGLFDLADLRGWLAPSDSLFARVEEVRERSRRRGPRAAR